MPRLFEEQEKRRRRRTLFANVVIADGRETMFADFECLYETRVRDGDGERGREMKRGGERERGQEMEGERKERDGGGRERVKGESVCVFTGRQNVYSRTRERDDL